MKNQSSVAYRTSNAKAVIFLKAIFQYDKNPPYYALTIEDFMRNSSNEEKQQILNSMYKNYLDAENQPSVFYEYGLYNIAAAEGNLKILHMLLEYAVDTGQIQEMLNSYNQYAFIKASNLSHIEKYKLTAREILSYMDNYLEEEMTDDDSFDEEPCRIRMEEVLSGDECFDADSDISLSGFSISGEIE